MRVAIYVALLVACAAAAPELTRAALASAAAVVFETLPYAAAAAALSPFLGRFAPAAIAYAGCGCGRGPGARSIPAALACAALFGPYVALARWVAAVAVGLLRRSGERHDHAMEAPLLDDLAHVVPAALLAGVLSVAAPGLALGHRSPVLQLCAGVLLGFAGAPCALGGVALASALHAQSPIAASAVLCIAGICDASVLWNSRHVHVRRDSATYAVLSIACVVIAHQHGATLVHPRMTLPLWACAAFCAWLAVRARPAAATIQRLFAGLLLAIAVLGSPPAPLVATEASLDDLYPGERIEFAGAYEPPRVIRYAITCCRADARPVAIELSRAASVPAGRWLEIRGVARRRADAVVVDAVTIREIAPPADPFVYL